MTKRRPKYLNLFKIRQPIPAVVSILHRVSGAVLFLFIPLLLYLLQRSLASPQAFADFKTLVGNPLLKIVLIGLAWAYLHHLCAGIRHLLLDAHCGLELHQARAASKAVLVIGIGLTVVLGALIW